MATLAELKAALVKADAAGNKDDAKALAAAIRGMSKPQDDQQSYVAKVQGDFDALPWYSKAATAATDTLRLANNGLSFGMWDRITPYLGGGTLDEERAKTADAKIRAGGAGTIAEMAGQMAPLMMLPEIAGPLASAVPAGVPGGQALARVGAGALEGSAAGGLQAAGEGRDVGEGEAVGAAGGAAGSAIAGILSRGANSIANKLFPNQNRMTVDQLRAAKDKKYEEVANMGVEYTPKTVKGLTMAMDAASPSSRVYPGVHDKVIAAREKVRDNLMPPYQGIPNARQKRDVSLPELDFNRQIIKRDVADMRNDNAQSSVGQGIIRSMDDYLRNVDSSGVTARSGNPEEGLQALEQARGLNTRMEKVDELGKRIDNAEMRADANLQTGADSTLRNNIISLLSNESKMRGFSPDEQAAMRKVVQGTPGENMLRQMGRLAPGGGMSLWSTIPGISLASQLGNPALQAAVVGAPAAIGYGSKKLAERAARKNVDDLMTLVSSGSKQAAQKTTAMSDSDRDRLARMLMLFGIDQ